MLEFLLKKLLPSEATSGMLANRSGLIEVKSATEDGAGVELLVVVEGGVVCIPGVLELAVAGVCVVLKLLNHHIHHPNLYTVPALLRILGL